MSTSLFTQGCSLQTTAFIEERFAALIERQRTLESQSVAEGITAFRNRMVNAEQAGTAAHTGGNKKLLSSAVAALSVGIQKWTDESKSRRGAQHVALKWCNMLGADVCAYMTVKAVLDVMALKMPLNEVAISISRYMLDQLRFRRFEEQAPGLFTYRLNSFSTSNYRHMARSMSATLNYAEVDVTDLDMSDSTKLLVGIKLLDILILTTGMVELVSKRLAKRGQGSRKLRVRQEVSLVPSQETTEWLTKRNDLLALMHPVNMPMVVPPLEWAPKERGGYRFALRGRNSLVRGGEKKADAARFDSADMPLVYETLNRLQETPWQINGAVLSLVRQIKSTGRELAGVPAFEPEEMPIKPEGVDTDPEIRRLYRKAKHAVHERNHVREVRTIEYSHTLHIAEELALDEAVYFPYNLDFRGRIYPISSFLSPQGADLSKGLLRFAEGKSLGTDGARWLALHGANCLGTTPDGAKMTHWSLDERLDWIDAHTGEIIGVACDPLGNQWWADAEKPLQFFAFCVEWTALETNPEGFVSHIPVAQDGSCNGLQHFSAMFRDEIGGAAVNLIPADTPQDIYQHIADNVMDALGQRAVSDPVALKWLNSGLVTRKLTKRPTMTFGYGSKKYGFSQQIAEYLKGHKDWQQIRTLFTHDDGKQQLHDACDLMAELIWLALQETVVAASEGMDWMQTVVNHVVETGKPVQWLVPATGFPVRQDYFEFTKKQIKTILAGKVIQPTYHEHTDVIRPQKQRNAIAPNVVHSLDAAALELTIHKAAEWGVDCFSMVHDSYATHASDCAALAEATREAFVSLYRDYDVVGSLFNQWCQQAGDTNACPKPPRSGELDINVILNSPYFFA